MEMLENGMHVGARREDPQERLIAASAENSLAASCNDAFAPDGPWRRVPGRAKEDWRPAAGAKTSPED